MVIYIIPFFYEIMEQENLLNNSLNNQYLYFQFSELKLWISIIHALIRMRNKNLMVKIILIGIIVALVYSQPDLRLTVADWLRAASDFLVESVEIK